jgi:hypothetical protein
MKIFINALGHLATYNAFDAVVVNHHPQIVAPEGYEVD